MFVTGESVFARLRVGLKLHSPESQKGSFDTFKKVMQDSLFNVNTNIYIIYYRHTILSTFKGEIPVLSFRHILKIPMYLSAHLYQFPCKPTDHLTPHHIQGNLLGGGAESSLTGTPGGPPLRSV